MLLSNVDKRHGNWKISALIMSAVSSKIALEVAAESIMAYTSNSLPAAETITGTMGRMVFVPVYAARSQLSLRLSDFGFLSRWKTVLCLPLQSSHRMSLALGQLVAM